MTQDPAENAAQEVQQGVGVTDAAQDAEGNAECRTRCCSLPKTLDLMFGAGLGVEEDAARWKGRH